jgi:hypothetical protein
MRVLRQRLLARDISAIATSRANEAGFFRPHGPHDIASRSGAFHKAHRAHAVNKNYVIFAVSMKHASVETFMSMACWLKKAEV